MSVVQRCCKPSGPLGTLSVLPPEIRNKIYQHVLQAPEGVINIRRRRQWPPNLPFALRYDSSSIHNYRKPKFTVEGSVADWQNRRCTVDKCVTMGLLRISKVVGWEAAGILYRRNRIVSKDDLTLREFGKKVGGLYAASLWDVPLCKGKDGIVLGF